jgi:hypothetical protein
VIQITPQMRILVAVEAVDGRNYAPSTNVSGSSARTSGRLRGPGRCFV